MAAIERLRELFAQQHQAVGEQAARVEEALSALADTEAVAEANERVALAQLGASRAESQARAARAEKEEAEIAAGAAWERVEYLEAELGERQTNIGRLEVTAQDMEAAHEGKLAHMVQAHEVAMGELHMQAEDRVDQAEAARAQAESAVGELGPICIARPTRRPARWRRPRNATPVHWSVMPPMPLRPKTSWRLAYGPRRRPPWPATKAPWPPRRPGQWRRLRWLRLSGPR